MGILDLPDDLKQRIREHIVDFLAHQAEKMPGGESVAHTIRQLSSHATFYAAFDGSMKKAVQRFVAEYTIEDEDLVEALLSEGAFWQIKNVRQALITMLHRPGSWIVSERDIVVQHFADVLPKRVKRERVDKAVTFFLNCVLDELWTQPGVSEIREIYKLQFQKIEAEAARQQVALLEAQLAATTALGIDIRQAFLQLAAAFEQRLLTTRTPLPMLDITRPYHNLPQSDCVRFVGRSTELEWLRRRLAPTDRTWQIVIAGIGGVGKSTLALTIAHDYCEQYHNLPPNERFEAIIWLSAKEEILTVQGRAKHIPPSRIFRTLEDMYTTIAQTLEREDITRVLLEEQEHLVQKALSLQRTLLIVDNLETVTDERIRAFLYHLPMSTKCIITSREWVDVASVLKLTGLPQEEAEKMIVEEAAARDIELQATERQRLFERSSGLPLPIKLSIARIASGETFSQILRWLGDATNDLSQYCIQGQIDTAYQRDVNAWRLLIACSLFDQDAAVSRDALGYTADLSLADRDNGLANLQRLSLLNRTTTDRFWILPLIQRYAGAELQKVDFSQALTDRWLDWLLKFAQQYSVDLDFHIEQAPIVAYEYLHLLSAIRWCQKHERWEALLQLVEGIWFYPYLVGLFGELREMLESAIHAARIIGDEIQEGRFIRRKGLLIWAQGQYNQQLVDHLMKAEEIAIRYNNDTELGLVGHTRVDVLYHQGHFIEAEQLARKVLEIGGRINNLELLILASYRLSLIAATKGQFDKAQEWLNQCEQWVTTLKWTRRMAWIAYYRGALLLQQQDPIAAEPFLIQSLQMATTWNERRLLALDNHLLAQVYSTLGQTDLSYERAERAHDLCERLGMTVELAQVELLRRRPV